MLLSRIESSKDRYYDYKNLILYNIFIEEPMYLRREMSCFALVCATLALREKISILFFSSLQATDAIFSPGYLELNLQA